MPAKKSKSRSTVPIVKKPKVTVKPEKQRKTPAYKTFRLQKTIKHPAKRLPSWWVFVKKSVRLMQVNKVAILGFVLIYGALTILLVRGLGSVLDVDGLREVLTGVVDEDTVGLATTFSGFSQLVDVTLNGGSDIAQLYQSILIILGSLAIIWLFRQQQAGNKVSIKDAFYKGMYPLVPYSLVLLILGLQLLPLLLTNYLFQAARSSDLIVSGFEYAVWIVLLLLSALLSFYMMVGSAFATYIVTVPEMTPMTALKEAKRLVAFRRMQIFTKLCMLFLVIGFVFFVVIVPTLFFVPVVAEWLFFTMTILTIPFIHGYLFSLYRELL